MSEEKDDRAFWAEHDADRAAGEAAGLKHVVKDNDECAHWCEACAFEAGRRKERLRALSSCVAPESLPSEAALADVHEQLEGAVAQPAYRPTESGWAYGGEGVGDG